MSRSFRGTARRALVLAGASTIALFTAGLMASPAQATHGVLTGEAKCDTTTGEYVVTYRLTNGWGYSGVLDEVTGAEGAIKTGATLPAGTGDGADSGNAANPGVLQTKVRVPGTTKSASLTIAGIQFSNGHHDTNDLVVTVTTEGDCKVAGPKPKPAAEIKVDCDTLAVKLINPTDAVVNFNFYLGVDGAEPTKAGETESLEAGETLSDEVALEEILGDEKPTMLVFQIRAQGQVRAEATWKAADCVEESPSPSTSPVDNTSPSASVSAEDELPVTGSSLTGLMVGALVAIGLGITGVVFARRRKQA